MEKLAELRALLDKATPGPWLLEAPRSTLVEHAGEVVANALESPDAALIVAAVNALPALLAVCEAAQKYIGIPTETETVTEWVAARDALAAAVAALEGETT